MLTSLGCMLMLVGSCVFMCLAIICSFLVLFIGQTWQLCLQVGHFVQPYLVASVQFLMSINA
jgi:hypothetical protein